MTFKWSILSSTYQILRRMLVLERIGVGIWLHPLHSQIRELLSKRRTEDGFQQAELGGSITCKGVCDNSRQSVRPYNRTNIFSHSCKLTTAVIIPSLESQQCFQEGYVVNDSGHLFDFRPGALVEKRWQHSDQDRLDFIESDCPQPSKPTTIQCGHD